MRAFLSSVLALMAAPALAESVDPDGIIQLTFKEIEEDTRMKVAMFLDDGAESQAALDMMRTVMNSGVGPQFVYSRVDCTNGGCEPAFKEGFPFIFTQTPEGGIERFGGEFNVQSFKDFNDFMTMQINEDKVITLPADGAAEELAKLVQTKPVILKMFEQWCGHCKKMKKHFQAASNQVTDVYFVEAECSAVNGFCNDFGVTGFPTVKFIAEGGAKMATYGGARTLGGMKEFLTNPENWEFTDDAPAQLSSGTKEHMEL